MTTRTLSRRKFIRTAGITLAVAAMTGATVGCNTQSMEGSDTPETEIETPSFVYGDEPMKTERILVAYATRTGTSVGVASAIGETLAARGFTVDVKPIQENPITEGYQTIILGSAINGANWLPEAVEYVKNHQQALNQAKVALFSVHIMNLDDDENSKKNRLAYLKEVRPLLKPIAEAFFAGLGMDPEGKAGIIRWAYRTFVGPEGDCRDWDKIRGWAQNVSL